MRKYRGKKKNNVFLLVILVLCVTIGYALLSATLNITGLAGINKNTWDIHWDRTSVNVSEGSISGDDPRVFGTNDNTVEFTTELELPGDFYEFTVDAINEGTIDGAITLTTDNVYEVIDGEEKSAELPDYILYTITYDDDTIPTIGDVLKKGTSKKYKIRVEYDSDATSVPDTVKTYKFKYTVTYGQYDPPADAPYKITFNANGGTVDPTYKYVEQGSYIGELPIPIKDNTQFLGWYTVDQSSLKIKEDYVPNGDMTLVAHWAESYTIFDTGSNVNSKWKTLAGDTLDTYSPWSTEDTNVISIERSSTTPATGVTTEIVSATGQEPIYTWYDNGVIYWYTEAEIVFLNSDASQMFNSFKDLASIDLSFYTNDVTNMSGMFASVKIPNLNLSIFDTDKVTNMSAMFSGSDITLLNVSSFDTHNVTDMSGMFSNTTTKNINVSNFNTSNVTNMSGMFSTTQFDAIDLSNFDTSKVTNISGMFSSSQVKSLDLSNFDTSKVTNFGGFVSGCSLLKSLNISNWNFNGITSFYNFFNAGLLQLETITLENVKTSSITNMSGMFGGCSSLKELDLSSFNVSNVTDFSGMFGGCSSLEKISIKGWNFDSVSSLSGFFSQGLTNLKTINLKKVNTANINDMSGMFAGCSSVTSLNLDSFNTRNVTNMSGMFSGMTSVTTISVSDDFVVTSVSSSYSSGMFAGCINLVGGMGSLFDPNYIDKTYAHYDNGPSDPGYFNKGVIKTNTVTFDPNGGEVNPTTKEVFDDEKIGEMPIPTREGYGFVGWYTEIGSGIEITEENIITDNVTYYAYWQADKNINYNANGGSYNDHSTNNIINYRYQKPLQVRYSYTPNINSIGEANGRYANNLEKTDVVTIPGATSLNVEVWYSTESSSDWLAIYPKDVVPSSSNYNQATISGGKLSGGYSRTKPSDSSNYHKIYTVNDDTVQFYFKSDTSSNYYGYYAIVTAEFDNYIRSNEYKVPTKDDYEFMGWNTKQNGSGKLYKTENEIFKDMNNINSSSLYAQWKKSYVITFDPNGGTISENSRTVIEGDTIGKLPIPNKGDDMFVGWYIGLTDSVRVDKDYIPSSNLVLYAKWGNCTAFTNDSWSTIAQNVRENPYTYPVGCTRDIDMGDLGVHTIRIANNTTPAECSKPGFSQTACGFVLEFTDVISQRRMNPYESLLDHDPVIGVGSTGGWPKTELRAYLNSDVYTHENVDYSNSGVYNALPADLRNVIIDTKTVTSFAMPDTELSVSYDKLYLLSPKELYDNYDSYIGTTSEPTDGYDIFMDNAQNKSRQLDYYNYKGVVYLPDPQKIPEVMKKQGNTPSTWWLRTVEWHVIGGSFVYIDEDYGRLSSSTSGWPNGVSPAFRIG